MSDAGKAETTLSNKGAYKATQRRSMKRSTIENSALRALAKKANITIKERLTRAKQPAVQQTAQNQAQLSAVQYCRQFNLKLA